MKGATFTNNGSITCQNLNFDSTTSLTGTGTYTPQSMSVGGTGNLSLANNVTISPTSGFTVTNGGIFNPNTRTLTFNSGSFIVNGGGTTVASGLIQSQGNVSLILRNGSNFNSNYKVNTGSVVAYNDQSPYFSVFNGTITVDAGATMNSQAGGYTIQANSTVTNNGNMSLTEEQISK